MMEEWTNRAGFPFLFKVKRKNAFKAPSALWEWEPSWAFSVHAAQYGTPHERDSDHTTVKFSVYLMQL